MDDILQKITNKSGEREEEEEEESGKGNDESKTLIIIYRNSETLNSFQRQYLLFDSSIINNGTTDFLSFNNIRLDNLSIDTYCCLFDENINFIEMVKIFIRSVRRENVHWIILLDWSIYDQQKWLEHILKCVKEINGSNSKENEHIINKTIVCINSEHIYKIQKNLPIWYSRHIDYIQQTLRWYSIQENCNLVYSETGQERLNETTKKIINSNTCKFNMEDIEMAKTTRIFIPCGYDNINLIKTLDETFNERECTIERYKEIIPAPINNDKQMGSLLLDSIESNIEYFDVTEKLDNDTIGFPPDFINEQKQYKQLLEYSRKLNRK